MKKIFLMSMLSIAVIGFTNAQTKTEQVASHQQLPQVRAKAMVSKITNSVGLQGEQIGKVNNLYIQYFTKLDGLGKTASEAQSVELTKWVNAELNKILSPSQQKLWKEDINKK